MVKLVESGFSVEVELIESNTEEFDAGWVFYYQSVRYLKTGDFQEMLIGNAPLFVPRSDASPQFISYHRPTSVSIDAFKYSGNANAAVNAEIELVGWSPGAAKVSAVQAIRSHSSLGLADAKAAVDRCLSKSSAKIQTTSVAAAHELVVKLSELRFAAKVTYDG